MPVETLKRFWPKFLAGKAREWVLERVARRAGSRRQVQCGACRQVPSTRILQGADAPDGAVNVELNFSGTSIVYVEELPPVVTGDAKLTVSGTEFSVDIPQGKIVVAEGQGDCAQRWPFLHPRPSRGSPAGRHHLSRRPRRRPTVLQLLDHEPLGYISAVGMKPDFLGGSAVGEFTLSMPMKTDLDFKEIKMSGLARLNDAIASNLVGDMDIEGGALDVELSDEGVTAKGDIKVKDVPAEDLLAACVLCARRPAAAGHGLGHARCRFARQARHQGQPSGQRDRLR